MSHDKLLEQSRIALENCDLNELLDDFLQYMESDSPTVEQLFADLSKPTCEIMGLSN